MQIPEPIPQTCQFLGFKNGRTQFSQNAFLMPSLETLIHVSTWSTFGEIQHEEHIGFE